jgi:putative transposase
MPEYRRLLLEGGTFFFTVVTYRRLPILTSPVSRNLLRLAWEKTMERYPFTTDALCLLPDHLHCILTLPQGDTNYSIRWGEIKRIFSKAYLQKTGEGEPRNESPRKRGEAAIWQRRFWEHTIRDETDLNVHLNYIHYNPVKHGLVSNVSDWPWSSFQRFVKLGFYDPGWGNEIKEKLENIECSE